MFEYTIVPVSKIKNHITLKTLDWALLAYVIQGCHKIYSFKRIQVQSFGNQRRIRFRVVKKGEIFSTFSNNTNLIEPHSLFRWMNVFMKQKSLKKFGPQKKEISDIF